QVGTELCDGGGLGPRSRDVANHFAAIGPATGSVDASACTSNASRRAPQLSRVDNLQPGVSRAGRERGVSAGLGRLVDAHLLAADAGHGAESDKNRRCIQGGGVDMIGTLLAAVALGFVGSLHCAGMCGPLVIAGAMREGGPSARALTSYLLGRLCSYAFVGALMGQIGAHALHRIPVQPFQAAVAAIVAAFAIWKAFRLSPRASQGGSLLVWLGRFFPRGVVGVGLAPGVSPLRPLVPSLP